jgi:hypothetical protein
MPFINPGEPTKEIYQFHNGVKNMCRDPSVLWRRINAACVKPGTDGTPGETWDALMKRWALCVPTENDTTETQIAKLTDYRVLQGTLAAVTREAFDLHELDDDGNGVNEEFAMMILCEFIGAREKKERSTETLPSESPPTVSAPATTSNESISRGRGRRSMTMGSISTPRSSTP